MHWGVKKMANVRVHLALRKIRTQNIIPIPKRERQTALREARADLAQAIDEPVNEPVLDLDFYKISLNDEDIKNLAQALQDNRTTTTLTLKNNKDITDNSAEIFLKALEKNRTLRTVNFEGTSVNPAVRENFQSKLDKKFAPKTPSFFASIWQGIKNISSKSNAKGAGGVPEGVKPDFNKDIFYQEDMFNQAEVAPQVSQVANPKTTEILAPGGAPAAAKASFSATPMAPTPPPEVGAIAEMLDNLKNQGPVKK